MLDTYRNSNCLITGGLGFIGSTLAIKLVELGADVTIIDAMIPEYGGNLFNIEPIKDKIKVNYSSVLDEHSMKFLVADRDFIFHLAAQVSHVKSLTDPFPDIDINIKGTALLMETCKKVNPGAIVVRTGTRGQYGPATKLPVNEQAPTNPKGIYEISQLTAEKIMKVYNDNFGIRSVLLRLTNIYGPRAQMRTPDYGVANWFIRLAIDDQTIKIFGDGKIKRDFLFVNDCVEAILKCAVCENAYGEIFNVGIDKPTDFLTFTNLVIDICGRGRWEFAPFSPERKAQEPGDFFSDISKIKDAVGWEPCYSMQDNLKETIEYYKKHKKYYW